MQSRTEKHDSVVGFTDGTHEDVPNKLKDQKVDLEQAIDNGSGPFSVAQRSV